MYNVTSLCCTQANASGYEERNLIGTPDDICEQVRRYEQAGVTTMAALLFTEPTVNETLKTMEIFAQRVISNFG